MLESVESLNKSLVPYITNYNPLTQEEVKELLPEMLSDKIEYNLSRFKELLEYDGFIYHGQDLFFSDDFWVIKTNRRENDNHKMKIIFDTDEWGVIEKIYAYSLTTANLSAVTLQRKVQIARNVLAVYAEYEYDFLSEDALSATISTMVKHNISEMTSNDRVSLMYIKEFLVFLVEELAVQVAPITMIDTLMNVQGTSHVKRSYPLLRLSYFQKLCELALQWLHDGNKDMTDRVHAMLLYLDAMTGLRNSEVSTLSLDCVKAIRTDYPDQYWIEYTSTKNSNSGRGSICHVPISKKTFDELEYYKAIIPKKFLRNGVLFPNIMTVKNHKVYSIYDNERWYNKFVLLHWRELEIVDSQNADTWATKVRQKNDLIKYIVNGHVVKQSDIQDLLKEMTEESTVALPSMHQFRVFAITQYLNAGVSLPELAKIYNHFDIDDTFGYARSGTIPNHSQGIGKTELNALKEVNETQTTYQEPSVFATIDDIIEESGGMESIESVNGGFCVSPTDQNCDELKPEVFLLPILYEPGRIVPKEVLPQLKKDIVDIKKIIAYNDENGFSQANKREKKKLHIMEELYDSILEKE